MHASKTDQTGQMTRLLRSLHINLSLICPIVSEKMFEGQTDNGWMPEPLVYYKLMHQPSAQMI